MSVKTRVEIINEAEKISSLIATARRLMSENKSVDLSKLEHKINDLCKRAKKINSNQSKEVQDILFAIIEDLNRLDNEITSLYKKSGNSSLEDYTKHAMDSYSPVDKES